MYNDADYIVFEPDEISAGRMNQITGDASGFGLDLALRAGTEQRINDISDERYALGFGLNVGVLNNVRVRIDYAYLIQDLENTQRISLAIQF